MSPAMADSVKDITATAMHQRIQLPFVFVFISLTNASNEHRDDAGSSSMLHSVVRSDFFLDVFPCDFAIPEDLGKESTTYGLAPINWNYCASTIRMTHEVVASLDSDKIETETAKRFDKLDAADCRKSTHAMTATRWTPTN